ncbi:unnamed protein product [Meganyctiphanes norvegica]|uniref:Ionotropic glutamate receptor C-terminal domain-containing protein n=1 Tax=Meganyctiphanes norvegica TaxID=48144 RepID=A0AAV2RR79_MEGNR
MVKLKYNLLGILNNDITFTSPKTQAVKVVDPNWQLTSFWGKVKVVDLISPTPKVQVADWWLRKQEASGIESHPAVLTAWLKECHLANHTTTSQLRGTSLPEPRTVRNKAYLILVYGCDALFTSEKIDLHMYTMSVCSSMFHINSVIFIRSKKSISDYAVTMYGYIFALIWRKCCLFIHYNYTWGVAILLKKDKFMNITELSSDAGFDLKDKYTRKEKLNILIMHLEMQLWNTFGKILNKNKQKHSKQSLLLYRISQQEIQTAIHNIKNTLDKIFNLAIKSGVYPHNLKIAKVIHVHKKELALIEIVDQIRMSLDENKITCGIFVDLSKAFDTVDHEILIDNCKSKTKFVDCGVPQGSSRLDVLRPLLEFLSFEPRSILFSVNLIIFLMAHLNLSSVNRWDQLDGINLTQTDMDVEADIMDNLQNQTLVVMATLVSRTGLTRNRSCEKSQLRARGTSHYIYLGGEIFAIMNKKYDICGKSEIMTDQVRSNTRKSEIMTNQRADLAIGDVTITSRREQAVDFSMPWMHTGIAILYKRPRRRPPRDLFYSFFTPLSLEIWIYIATAFIGVSILLFLIARFSPYERMEGSLNLGDSSPKMENQFTLANSFWFVWGSILQQKTDQQPRAVSTRIVAGMWWFFTLILICAYTANMAVYFFKGAGSSSLDFPITNVHDLAAQTMIKYGTVKGGSTSSFFSTSYFPTYQKMFTFMESQFPSVYVNTNEEGMQRVKEDDGAYAFLMESSSIEYITERRCDLIQVGGNLDSKSYGIALPPGSPYLPQINQALLQLQEDGILGRLKKKWWTYMRGGGRCKQRDWSAREKDYYSELGVHNVAGLFILLLAGMGLAIVVAVCEFAWNFWKSRTNTTQ